MEKVFYVLGVVLVLVLVIFGIKHCAKKADMSFNKLNTNTPLQLSVAEVPAAEFVKHT